MSEFTYGNIIRTVDRPKLFKHLPAGTPILRLSAEWLAFFTSKDGEFAAPKQLETLSAHCPIMYFSHLEDHGWGFEIFHRGKAVSNLQIMYGMDDEEAENLLGLFGETAAEKLGGFLNPKPNVRAFSLFGLNDEEILTMEKLLAGNLTFDEEKGYLTVEKFKELLGIEEMSWIRFERTEGREGIEYV